MESMLRRIQEIDREGWTSKYQDMSSAYVHSWINHFFSFLWPFIYRIFVCLWLSFIDDDCTS
jgi:hypothetical protein